MANSNSIKRAFCRTILFTFLTLPLISSAQSSRDYSVLLSAEVQTSPPGITLYWPPSQAVTYTVYRKLKTQMSFSTAIATLNGSDSSYTDNNVSIGTSYEYCVRKNNAFYYGYGYINCGIEVPADDVKGRLILLIDSSQVLSLESEIDRLLEDLDVEGWAVQRYDVSKSKKPSDIRDIIIDEYSTGPVRAVFILGHVPVPYSGNFAPDGHANHVGAWPCDAYYGDINGTWLDLNVSNTTSSDNRNHNIPGDGKFDHSMLPSGIELQVGRVDFNNMPAFAHSETELLRRYLDKDHNYRVGKINTIPRAVIDDNFGGFSGEAFGSSGWKAFSTMYGPDSIMTGDYFTELRKTNFQWSYGCGGGSYTSAGGIGNTANFSTDSLRTVFTCLFGSYFGDWDSKDNFLRAPLAQGLTLTDAWSGRPHWHFHHMSLGENIGYSMWLAVNATPYSANFYSAYSHIGLMGDPTLRLHIISPPSDLQLAEVSNQVELNWTASSDDVLGYYIYRKENKSDNYVRLTDNIVSATSFIDGSVDHPSNYIYCVRPVRLEKNFSGSYYNSGPGISGEIQTQYSGVAERDQYRSGSLMIAPNPSNGRFDLIASNLESGSYTICLQNSGGQIVHAASLDLRNGHNHLDFSNGTSPGFYFLIVKGNQMCFVRKLSIVY